MDTYCKVFATILGSTVWNEPHETVRLWITLLVLKDQNGLVEASIPGLASYARISIPECEEALARFMGPDKYSRTKLHEGRRLEEVDGGWRVLNHEKYRQKMSIEHRKEQTREASRRYRAKKRKKDPVDGPPRPCRDQGPRVDRNGEVINRFE